MSNSVFLCFGNIPELQKNDPLSVGGSMETVVSIKICETLGMQKWSVDI
jgi:hypothetical protein